MKLKYYIDLRLRSQKLKLCLIIIWIDLIYLSTYIVFWPVLGQMEIEFKISTMEIWPLCIFGTHSAWIIFTLRLLETFIFFVLMSVQLFVAETNEVTFSYFFFFLLFLQQSYKLLTNNAVILHAEDEEIMKVGIAKEA